MWVPASRRHADPSSLLLPDEQWRQVRCEFPRAVERPIDGDERLHTLAGEQAKLLERLARERDATAEAQLDDGELVVNTGNDADTPDGCGT